MKRSFCYSLIADEATNITQNEQLCISVRWVDHELNIHEDSLGLIPLPDTKAQTILKQINDVLIRCSLSISNCRGQAYDGTSNMSGIHNGVKHWSRERKVEHCMFTV